jgi:catechol 2,3-dioxygenase-like lactoylglutathione lyase family enzyme
MMTINQIKETCLYFDDLHKAKDFYHEKLGLPIIMEEDGQHIFFRAGTSVLLCFAAEASKQKQAPPPHYAYGPQHIAFEVPSEEYEAWKEKIKALGIAIIQEQTWKDGLQSFYFHDSEGHVLEVIPPRMWD